MPAPMIDAQARRESDPSAIRSVTVIAPMRDEAAHVDGFVADLAAQDFDGSLQVLVADGGSSDGSVALLEAAARRAGLSLRVLPNPAGWVSPGLNACVAEATGDLIVRLDCHSRYPPDYVRRCVRTAEETGAWNVGGQVTPVGETTMERAVACAMDSPFGGIGWTRTAGAQRPVEVDTVTFGAFRPEAFRTAGLFDEELVRNQDDEFNLRLRRAGGRIVLDPAITVRYRPRGSLSAVWRQYYEYGLWKVPVMRKHRRVLTARSLAPLAFVASLSTLAMAAPAVAPARRLLAAELSLYLGAAGCFALRAVRRRGEPATLLPLVAATFATFHAGYGAGMASGLLRAAPVGRRAGSPV
jgi:succinoglycan biosynthesis protein ExoA